MEKTGQTFAGEAFHGVLLIVPAGEQDREVRAELSDLLEDLRAVQARHSQVEDDGDDIFDMRSEGIQPLFAVLRRQDIETQFRQQIAGAFAHARFIIDKQDGAGAVP